MPETINERITRVLHYMEYLRMCAMETETDKESKAMMREYNALWNLIKDDLDARPR